tara:strand:+ start:1017 stop:2363 length:1347 start_codon:yes stop_codon:yes gene_type:complete
MINPVYAFIPGGYKADELYNAIPYDKNFEFARASIARRVNKDSLIEVVGNSIPRLTYQIPYGKRDVKGNADNTPSYLMEPASTNLVTYSSDYNVGWSGTNVNMDKTKFSPAGQATMSPATLLSTAGNGTQNQWVQQQAQVFTNQVSCWSVFMKAGKSGLGAIYLYDTTLGGAGIEVGVSFDLINGSVADETLGVNPPRNTGMYYYGNGWYRCFITYNKEDQSSKTWNPYFRILISINSTQGNQLPLNTSLYIWGAMVESEKNSNFPTSYIATQQQQVTRTKDEAFNSTLDIASQQGIFYAYIKPLNAWSFGGQRQISINDGTNDNVVTINFSTINNTTLGIQVSIKQNGSSIFFYNSADEVDNDFYADKWYKIAIFWSKDDGELYINGKSVRVDTQMPEFQATTFTEISFENGSGFNDFEGYCKELLIYDTRSLSRSEVTKYLQILTQ